MRGAYHPAGLYLLIDKALHYLWALLGLFPVALTQGEVKAGVRLGGPIGGWSL